VGPFSAFLVRRAAHAPTRSQRTNSKCLSRYIANEVRLHDGAVDCLFYGASALVQEDYPHI
jgi:hypothetical protein